MKKIKSLIIILIIYLFAALSAFLSAMLLKQSLNQSLIILFISDVIATIVIFIASMILNNASVYDPYWSVQVPVLLIGFYIIDDIKFNYLHLIIIIPLLLWAIRLTVNWISGFDNLKWQDWRYRNFKIKFPRIFPFISFTGIMLLPTCLVFLGTLPLSFIIQAKANILFYIISGMIIFISMLIQLIADYQLKKFKKKAKPDECMQTGLWKYSRHPNYLGEIGIWWGVFAGSIPLVTGLNTAWILCGAGFITLLFIFISIPLMEKHMIARRPSYKDYQKSVSMLVFWFKKKDK